MTGDYKCTRDTSGVLIGNPSWPSFGFLVFHSIMKSAVTLTHSGWSWGASCGCHLFWLHDLQLWHFNLWFWYLDLQSFDLWLTILILGLMMFWPTTCNFGTWTCDVSTFNLQFCYLGLWCLAFWLMHFDVGCWVNSVWSHAEGICQMEFGFQ